MSWPDAFMFVGSITGFWYCMGWILMGTSRPPKLRGPLDVSRRRALRRVPRAKRK